MESSRALKAAEAASEEAAEATAEGEAEEGLWGSIEEAADWVGDKVREGAEVFSEGVDEVAPLAEAAAEDAIIAGAL
jgi:hypothetical protein